MNGVIEVHVRPVVYEVTVWPEAAYDDPAAAMNASEWCVRVEQTPGFDGIRWAIRWAGRCLSRSGRWDLEPIPSSRTDHWKRQHRYASLEDAIERAKRQAPEVAMNGYTARALYEQWQS